MERTAEEILRENFILNEITEILVKRLEKYENKTKTIAHLITYYKYSNEDLIKIGYKKTEIIDAHNLLEQEELEEQIPF